MANINISVGALVCEAPQFTSVTYTGTRFEFNMNWTSNADYYYSIDPTVSMTLMIQLYRPNEVNPYYTGNVAGPIPFNANNFMVNILDYEGEFTTKDIIVFTLLLSGEDSCNTQDTYTIPSESIP